MKVLIVGVGLIGGSFSLALKKYRRYQFGGYDTDHPALDQALELGIIEKKFEELTSGVRWADLIVLAVPVKAIREILPKILDLIEDGQIVVDFGSTKHTICQAVDKHPRRKQFVAGHPIAGTEYSGPSAAFASLYQDKNLILCDTEATSEEALEAFEAVAKEAGFYVTKMSSVAHDRHLAYISHLSHISSYVLSHTVLQKEKDGEVILELAGSGFESTVRLAKSSPDMWTSIFIENREMILAGIQAYMEELQQLKEQIATGAEAAIYQYLEEGRAIRKILK